MATLRNGDRVVDTSTSTGTGDFTVAGTPADGYITFDDIPGIAVGDRVWIGIAHKTLNEFETCEAIYQGSGVLSRNRVLQSTNGGALVNFSVGDKTVFCTLPASKASNWYHICNADTTFYVADDGDELNSGLDALSPWPLQYALDQMAAVDGNGYGVTIQAADGTYAAASAGSYCVSILYRPRNAKYFYISGNSGTPANVILDGASSGAYGILIGSNYDTAAQLPVIIDDLRGFTVKDAFSMVTMFTYSQAYIANMRSENNSRVYDVYGDSNVNGGGGIVVAGAHDYLVRGSQFSNINVSGSISFETGATMATSVYKLDQTANATVQSVVYTNLTNSGTQYDIAAFCLLDTGGNLASIPGSAGTVDALGKVN